MVEFTDAQIEYLRPMSRSAGHVASRRNAAEQPGGIECPDESNGSIESGA